MATVSGTQCFCAVLLTIILTWLPGEAVYFESAYSQSQSQKQERGGHRANADQRQRRRERNRNNDAESEEEGLTSGRSERRREPFQRTLVLCYTDDECDRKHFCHGGEGHKSCVPCRKSRKRCHRNDMCCKGYSCQEGRCRVKGPRSESSNTHDVEDALSYSEAEDSFWNREIPRKKHHGEACENGDDCQEGLCCARHLWSKVCMPMLEEGDLCTKKKDRLSDLFQRCECSVGLSCKRVPNVNTRLHACFPVKTFPSSPDAAAVNSEPTSSREPPDVTANEVPIPSSSSKRKRQSGSNLAPEAESEIVRKGVVQIAYSIEAMAQNRTDSSKGSELAKESSQSEMTLS